MLCNHYYLPAAFPRQTKFVLNAYSVFPSDHFDVHAVLYLIVDIHFILPSVTITINSMTTPLHLEYSFHLKLLLNLFQPLSVCWFVCVCVCVNLHVREQVAGKAIYSLCATLLKITHPCFQVVTNWIVSLFAFSETNSKLIFKCRYMCPLTHSDFIYVFLRVDMQYGVVIKSSTSLLKQWVILKRMFTGMKLTLVP